MKRITHSLQLQILTLASLLIFAFSSAQVGVNKTNPDATLDIAASNQAAPANNDGLLIPRIDAFPAANPGAAQDGMLVFHTTLGFHYWDNGTASWQPFSGGGGPDWAFAGNATTGTEILGTTNGDNLRIHAGGAERILVESDGQVLVNLATPYFATDQFSAEGTFAINGYTNAAAGIGTFGAAVTGTGVQGESLSGEGVIGISDSSAGVNGITNTGSGVLGQATAWIGVFGQGPQVGVVGDDFGANTTGVQGQTDAGVGTIGLAITSGDGTWGLSGSGEGVYGNSIAGAGVWGETDSFIATLGSALTTGDGVWGLSITGDGVYGDTGGAAGFGGVFTNSNANGIGLVAGGNNAGLTTIGTGAGISGTGNTYGSMGFANNGVSTGLIGVANNVNPFYTIAPNGSGVAGTGTDVGVAGFSDNIDGIGVIGLGGTGTNGVGVQGQGNWGVVGIGNTGNGDWGVYGIGKSGVYGEAASAVGPNNFGVYSNGDSGASGAKLFHIDHPLDPDNKYLRHASIESNEILNLYRGVEIFNNSGTAIVELPNYYDAINKNASYQLTPIGAAMPNLFIEQEIENGVFVISGGIPGKKVSWLLTAERNDLYMQKYPEKRKMEIDKGVDSGKYLRPDLFNKSMESAIYMNPIKRESTVNNAQKAMSPNSNMRSSITPKDISNVKRIESEPHKNKRKKDRQKKEK